MTPQGIFKLIFILLTGLCWVQPLLAQDTLKTRKQGNLVVKIVEIDKSVVKYKKLNNLNGPEYILDKSQIYNIQYLNGTADTFSVKTAQTPAAKTPAVQIKDSTANPNAMFVTVTDAAFGYFTFGYERVLKNKKISVKIPVSLGFKYIGRENGDFIEHYYATEERKHSRYYHPYKIFSTGLEVCYYPAINGVFRYFISPAVEYGQYFYSANTTHEFFSMLLKNGLVYSPTKKFFLSATLGAGISVNNDNFEALYPFADPEDLIAFNFGIAAGFRF